MVVCGIAGEYGFSARIGGNATKLQQIADEELAGSISTAGKAFEAAFRNEREAAVARTRIQQLLELGQRKRRLPLPMPL